MENKFSRELQRNLRQRIRQIDANPARIVISIDDAFSINLISSFLRAVGNNARLRWFSILKEFFTEQNRISTGFPVKFREDVTIDELQQIEANEIDRFIDRPFYGATIIQRIETLRSGLGERAITAFASGMKSGLGYGQIMENIRHELAIGGSQLERLVRTEGQRISNDILLATYEKNKKNIGGIMYQATLDMRTCETCGHYDRDEYWYDGVPNAGKAPYVPLHPMCRCVYVPISKEWRNKTSRASMFGPIDTDYKEWLKSAEVNDPGFAKPILGKNYNSWKQGNYTPSDKLTPQITYSNYLTQTKGIRND